MVRRTAADAAATRQAILAAATALFAADGYTATSMDAIAEGAGVTRGAVHHHFGDKRSIFVEVFTQLEHELNDAVATAALSAPAEGFAPMRAACAALFAFFARDDYQRIGLADGPAVLGLMGWYEIDRGLGMPTMRAGIQGLADDGLLAPEMVEPVTMLIFGALTEAAITLGTGASDVSADQVIDTVERLMTGLIMQTAAAGFSRPTPPAGDERRPGRRGAESRR